METISNLNNSQPFQQSAKKCLFRDNIADYILLALISVFFAIPFAGLSLHYFKFGVPPRLVGLVDFFLRW
jgi:hypothetical protein